jgi:3-deoxy-D-manno-octulosonic acid kinase
MIVEGLTTTARTCILYDASRVRKEVECLFEPAWWSANGGMEQVTGGRGSVMLLRYRSERWVLRHYRRGGLIAKLSADRYLWTGEARTRSFAEWRLLARLRGLGLPVPAPIAAQYSQRGITYTADLITELLADTRTLASAMRHSVLQESTWRAIGRTIALFHSHGVHHADLNANNILLSVQPSATLGARRPRSAVYLLDFDRGRIRDRGSWEAEVLARFRRSLEKISVQAGQPFDERQWMWTMEGYAEVAN